MVSPEAIYLEGHAHADQPPIWLDCTFLFIMTIIHLSYAFKFTKFSLAYLNAKCEERKSRRKWSTSRLYLHAIKSEELNELSSNIEPNISTKLWSKIAFIRMSAKIFMFVICWIVVILYITLQLNIIFEYLIVCYAQRGNGAFLALLIFPALIFVNIGVLRYIFYGIMSTWSINLDNIADEIAYEQQSLKAKEVAYRGAERVSAVSTPLIIFEAASVQKEESKNEEMEFPETDQRSWFQAWRENINGLIASFTSPYWMAVHWRLMTIFCCVIATIFAIPKISKGIREEAAEGQILEVTVKYFNFPPFSRILIGLCCYRYSYYDSGLIVYSLIIYREMR